ncbi:nitroreductase family protein [Thermoproteota archaeon]
MNETIDTIKSRRSIRKYNDKPISKEIINKLLECAILAPSARNRQLWRFIVVTDRNLIKEMSDSIMDEAVQASSITKERKKTMEDPIFYKAPVLVLVLKPKDYEWAKFDCSAASQNMMLAAKSLGIGSIALGKGDMISSKKDIITKLDIPKDHDIHIVLAFGYTDEWPEAPERKNPDVKWIE